MQIVGERLRALREGEGNFSLKSFPPPRDLFFYPP